MRIRTKFTTVAAGLATYLTGLLAASLQACPPETVQIRILLPEAVKAGTPLVFAAKPLTTDVRVQAVEFRHESFGSTPIIAQRDFVSGKFWFVARVAKPVKTTKVTARAVKPTLLVRITEKDGELQFVDRGRIIMHYQRDARSKDGEHTRANYVHPLFGLDGETLTQDFPADHRHHRGVFWAWHQLLVGDRRAGDPWMAKDFLTVVQSAEVLDEGPVFATLRIKADWTSPDITDDAGKTIPIIEETTIIRVFRATDQNQSIDFRIELKPVLPDVKIGGAENVKEYSGFTVRVKPPQPMKISTATERLSADGRGIRTSWSDVSGLFGDNNKTSGIAILSHVSLPEFPPRWLLRHYGMQNVIYPGRHPIALDPKRPLVLRHRLLIHRGDANAAHVAAQQTNYEKMP